jgi:hypothetical protein
MAYRPAADRVPVWSLHLADMNDAVEFVETQERVEKLRPVDELELLKLADNVQKACSR